MFQYRLETPLLGPGNGTPAANAHVFAVSPRFVARRRGIADHLGSRDFFMCVRSPAIMASKEPRKIQIFRCPQHLSHDKRT